MTSFPLLLALTKSYIKVYFHSCDSKVFFTVLEIQQTIFTLIWFVYYSFCHGMSGTRSSFLIPCPLLLTNSYKISPLYIYQYNMYCWDVHIGRHRLFTPHPPFLLWPHLIRYFFPYTYQYNMSCGDVHIWRHRFFTPAINKHKFFSRTTGLNICIIYGPPFNVSEYVHVIVFIFYPTRWWCTR